MWLSRCLLTTGLRLTKFRKWQPRAPQVTGCKEEFLQLIYLSLEPTHHTLEFSQKFMLIYVTGGVLDVSLALPDKMNARMEM